MSLDRHTPSHPFLVIISFALFALVGCASGDIDEAVTCSNDSECGSGQFCNQLLATCENVRSVNNGFNNNADAGNNGTTNNANNGVDMADTDDGTVACNPTCADNQVCDNGSCVSACMPTCEAPATCTANGCEFPACTAEGDVCDPQNADQGAFFCLANAEGDGSCYSACDSGLNASSCPTGQYCWDVGETTEALVCLDSQCQTDSECSGGTCINFDNGFGVCFTAGAKTEGQACDASMSECVAGTLCRTATSGGTTGVCTELCDLFGASTCGIGEVCGPLFTTREAFCTSDTTTTGSGPYQICTATGDYCDDAMRCWQASTTESACFPYCRPNTTDCDGVLPVELNLGFTDGVCHHYTFPGDRSIGICEVPCDPTDVDPCGPNFVCPSSGDSANLCRRVCTSATVTADCCSGTTPCPFTCGPDGLCE